MWRVVATVPGPGPLVAELRARGAQVELVPVPVLRKSALRPAGLLGFAWELASGRRCGWSRGLVQTRYTATH